jgi:hypothetical protein
MTNKNESVWEGIQQVSNLITVGKYDEASRLIVHLRKGHPSNKTLEFNRIGLLVDIGTATRRANLIKSAIAAGRRYLCNVSDKNIEAQLHWTLGDAYSSLFSLSVRRGKKVEQLFKAKQLQDAKKEYRNAIGLSEFLDKDCTVRLYVNYGNCLDTLGRSVESFYAYDDALKIKASHPMALGNKAMALKSFADVSGKYRAAMYIDSYHMLREALKNPELDEIGGPQARRRFRQVVKLIEDSFKNKAALSSRITHEPFITKDMPAFERHFIEFCFRNRLFLNLHVHEHNCEVAILDPAFIEPIASEKEFYDLAKYINQIKEDFITARFLLIQSQFKRDDLTRISKRTTFANTQDGSGFNLYMGFLKSAFAIAYDLLDKIALFINKYYKIGLDERIVEFLPSQNRNCLWYEEDGQIRKRLIESDSISLFALYDIHLDLRSGYARGFPELRNAIIHRKLAVNIADPGKPFAEDTIGFKKLLSQTTELMQITRSAVLYLIDMVQEDTHKARMRNALQHWSFDDTQLFPD